jgi:hypothetical protein
VDSGSPARDRCPPAFVTGENGRDLIPLTTGEAAASST